jgi:cobalt-zinc-cadmium efflux system membrane fusion protein
MTKPMTQLMKQLPVKISSRPPSLAPQVFHALARLSLSMSFIMGLSGLLAMTTSGMAQAAATTQIKLSKEQIARAGIVTELTEAAVTSSAVNATGANPSANASANVGQQLSGTVVAPTNAISVVSSTVSGVVQTVHLSSLQAVQPATTVATLFSQQLLEIQRDYLQLSTQARLAKEKQERDEALFKDDIIALSRVQESRAAATLAAVAASERHQALRAAGMSAAQLRSILSTHALSPYLSVSAGVRGTVLELKLANGQHVDAGMPLATIARDTELWIEFQASRQQAEQIRLGDQLQIKGCTANAANAKVIAISPQINGSNQSTLIRARASSQDACLKLNQFVEASHSSSQRNPDSVGVPAAAIVRNGADSYVFVRNGLGFEAVKVQVIPGSADKTWVSGKLKAGDAVAVKGIIAIKGAWIGLGAEEAGAPVPAASIPATSATPSKPSTPNGAK